VQRSSYCEAMATDQSETSSMVQTSMGYRSTALHINKNWLMYRALLYIYKYAPQINCSTKSTSIAYTERKKTTRKKENVLNQNSF
jgi:hypothetical protein